MSNKSTSTTSLTTSMLLVAFIVLKLCKVIDWSWWWVLSPIWIPLCFLLLIGIVWLFFLYLDHKRDKRNNKIKFGGEPIIKQKSRWQQRVEEIQAEREKLKNQK
jgi:hypothetical protein